MSLWATPYLPALAADEPVIFRPRGNSMTPRIKSGQVVTVVPLGKDENPAKGDVVLCKVKGAHYLHLVKAIAGDRFLIANNHGHENGWTERANIFGKLAT